MQKVKATLDYQNIKYVDDKKICESCVKQKAQKSQKKKSTSTYKAFELIESVDAYSGYVALFWIPNSKAITILECFRTFKERLENQLSA
jgi:protein-arginine kinase activator protein McsA